MATKEVEKKACSGNARKSVSGAGGKSGRIPTSGLVGLSGSLLDSSESSGKAAMQFIPGR
jgi:hypothetical protein